MILLVDVGNSRIKFIQQDKNDLSGYGAGAYNKSDPGPDLDRLWDTLPVPEQIWIANVAGEEIANRLVLWCEQNWHKTPCFATVEKQSFGVTNAYPDIAKLGVDRWMSMIAAWHKYRSPSCIVSCGTAVTLDGLDEHGRHVGGLIIPGITMMQLTLFNTTTAIPEIKGFRASSELADNTEQAVVNGCSLAVVSLVEHVMSDMQKKYNTTVKCLVTGGDSEIIMDLLSGNPVHEPLLVLEGLSLFAGNHS